jgi:hypothetical protein
VQPLHSCVEEEEEEEEKIMFIVTRRFKSAPCD